MVYGPRDLSQLASSLRHYAEEARDNRSELLLAHSFPIATSADLMIKQITETMQSIEGTVGREFTDAFMVMPEDDALSPWANGFGQGDWVLTYKPGSDYKIYAIHRQYLYDWYEPGGRWTGFMKILPDQLDYLTASMFAHPGQAQWISAPIKAVDWNTMGGDWQHDATKIVQWRADMFGKGIVVPTLEEYFHLLHPTLNHLIDPDELAGYRFARRWATHTAFREMIQTHSATIPLTLSTYYSSIHRWSSATLLRLGKNAAKVMTGFIVNDTLYDLEDEILTEELLNKGLDQLEALHGDTLVTVVDIHY